MIRSELKKNIEVLRFCKLDKYKYTKIDPFFYQFAASMSSSSKENNSGPASDNDYMVMSPSSSSAATSLGNVQTN